MAKITRIKAKDSTSRDDESDAPAITRKKITVEDKKSAKAKQKSIKKAEKKLAKSESGKKPFILIRPFVYLWRYLRGAWHEIRQVRWPNRKATWKMVFAVLVYTAFFMILILLLDMLFTWLFNLILG